MDITLAEMFWEITEDAAWTDEKVGLASGDIYLANKPFGHYVAVWYLQTARPLQMIVTAVNDSFNSQLSVGFKCSKGCPDSLTPVEPVEIPWDGDGVLFGPVVSLQDIDSYTLAQRAVRIAPEIIRLDSKLYGYVYP